MAHVIYWFYMCREVKSSPIVKHKTLVRYKRGERHMAWWSRHIGKCVDGQYPCSQFRGGNGLLQLVKVGCTLDT